MQARWTLAAGMAVVAATACAGGGGHSGPLTSLRDSASYAVGMGMGNQLAQVKDEVEVEQVIQALRDVLEGDTTRMTPMDAQRVMQAYGAEVQQRQQVARAAEADSNRAAGEAYLAENAGRPGVQVTESGLQYEVLTEGQGPKPTATDRVQVHYRGTLVDGREFDSSYGGEPAVFSLAEVIPGWSEAVQLMSVGSKYRFVLPSDIAYGQMGSPPDIGPNATIIFEVELLGIE